jgi:carbonic anhydrase/acetyltransferase-like protein (isoleucine patch superfamily)
MMYSSQNKKPQIDESAYVAPTAVVSGDVKIGAGAALLHYAVVTSEGGPIEIGEGCVVMEHAVIRATSKPVKIGEYSVIAPHASLVDVSLPDDSHVPTGATQGENARARNAETYAAFLRKAHGNDAQEERSSVAPPPRISAQKSIEVQGVDDAMMQELAELEHRRQEALRKQRGKG